MGVFSQVSGMFSGWLPGWLPSGPASRARVRQHHDDDQIAALVSLVALINAANRLAVIVHQQAGSCEPAMFAATFS